MSHSTFLFGLHLDLDHADSNAVQAASELRTIARNAMQEWSNDYCDDNNYWTAYGLVIRDDLHQRPQAYSMVSEHWDESLGHWVNKEDPNFHPTWEDVLKLAWSIHAVEIGAGPIWGARGRQRGRASRVFLTQQLEAMTVEQLREYVLKILPRAVRRAAPHTVAGGDSWGFSLERYHASRILRIASEFSHIPQTRLPWLGRDVTPYDNCRVISLTDEEDINAALYVDMHT